MGQDDTDLDMRETMQIRAMKRAASAGDEYAKAQLANRGIDPAEPEAPPHPFLHGRTMFFPSMTREEAREALQKSEARRANRHARGRR